MSKYLKSQIDEDVMKMAQHLTEIARTLDRKYGKNEVFNYISDDLKAKFDKQEAFLYKAISEKDKEKTLRLGASMVRAWMAVDGEAESNNAPIVDVDVWRTTHPLYPDVPINVTKTRWTQRRIKGEVWVCLDELIPFISETIAKVKQEFPGSEIKGFYDDDIPF